MREHRCTFDSTYGFVPGRFSQALMCSCGAWAMPAGGEWHAVPEELLPSACAHLNRTRQIECRCAIVAALAVILLFLWLVLGNTWRK